jgi:hypothetical protein
VSSVVGAEGRYDFSGSAIMLRVELRFEP